MNPSLEQLVQTLLTSECDNSTESGGKPLDQNYSISDVDSESLDKLHQRFQTFIEEAEKALTIRFGDKWSFIDDFYTGSGVDGFYTERSFIMTANDHGCGFWEKGDWQDGAGDILTKLAQKHREIHAYVGDDNKIYFYFG